MRTPPASVARAAPLAVVALASTALGLGAGGVNSYFIAGMRGSLYRKVGVLAVMNAIVLVFCLWFLLSRTASTQGTGIATAYFTAAIPFVIAGTIISLVVADTIEQVNRVYFFDLVGAAGGVAVGALAGPPLAPPVTGMATVAAAVGLACATTAPASLPIRQVPHG